MRQTQLNRALVRASLLLLGLVGLFVACRRIEEPLGDSGSTHYAILYSGNQDGEIEPCG